MRWPKVSLSWQALGIVTKLRRGTRRVLVQFFPFQRVVVMTEGGAA